MRRFVYVALTGWLLSAGAAAAQRINQEGRILDTLPVVTSPILFNTTNADAVVSAMQVFLSQILGTRIFPIFRC